MTKKIVQKVVIFIIILISIVSLLNPIFIVKTDHRGKLIEGLYNHTGDAYDVILMGSSHMNGGIDPNVLWHQYGITSFNYATAGQPIDVTYYLLKEVLKKHKNPIVVVDVYYLCLTNKYGEEGYIRYVIDSMKPSINKLNAIMNCTPFMDLPYYLFPILKYHNRWPELTKNDFRYDSAYKYYAKGFEAGTNKYGKDNISDLTATGTAELPPKSLEYLNKFIELSKKEGFKLIFTNMPNDFNSIAGKDGWVKDPAKMLNQVAEIAKANNIPFIDYGSKMDEIGFNFKEDMNNSGHVNIWGANKVTNDLGKFLKENYNLADHRNDPKYAQWSSDYMRSQIASLSK